MERLVDPLTTTDAKLWADEFMKVKARLGEQKFDHAMMLGWFANAIMQGYDEGRRRAKADAQATVEALQAEKLMLERGVSAQSALIDDLQSQLIQRTAALEAVQHERDEANSHVKFLGATKQANGSFCLDMKKYHARYRCGRHRDDPWKGIDTEIDCFVCLKHALDAEREKVKGLEDEGVKLFEWRLALHSLTPGGSEFCTPDACEQWVRKNRTSQHEYIIEQIKQRKGLQTQLSQLQALVRAKEDAYEKILLSRERLEREMRGYPPVDNEGIPMVWQEPVGWVKRHPGRPGRGEAP